MVKADLINAITESTGLLKKDVATVVDATLQTLTDALAKGEDVTLNNFGVFSVKARNARPGRNPKTGVPCEIPAAKVPVFKAGKGLKDAVN